MKKEQRVFQGEIPKIASHLLPENKGVLAKNTKLFSGNLHSFKQLVEHETIATGIKTIYQYRDGSNTYWFTFPNNVDVVESPVADDANNRVYMSGTANGLRWTDNSLALTGGGPYPLFYPAADRTLVFTPPGDAPNTSITAPDPDDTDEFTAETRQYLYTYVTADGWESSPSPISVVLNNVYPGQEVTVSVLSNPGTLDLDILNIRIYRTTPAGTIQLVTEQPKNIAGVTYKDIKLTENLSDVLETASWLPASNALKGLTVLDQGALCAFQNNELWFSEPYIPYGWPLSYRLSTMFDIVAITASSQSIYIATEGKPYVAFGTAPGEYQLVKVDVDLPCVSKESMVDAGEVAYYASINGIVKFEETTAYLISGDIIEAAQWNDDYNPTSLIGIWFDNKVFYFSNVDSNISFIFDPQANDIVHIDVGIHAVYNSLEENKLYIAGGGKIFEWDSHSSSFMSYEYRSRDYISSPTWYSCAQVNAESYNDLIFDLYRDDVLVHSKTVVDNVPFRLPTKRARKYSYALRGTDEVRGVFMASSMSELTNV